MEEKKKKPDLFDNIILIFSLVILVLIIFTFAMKYWLGA